MTEETPSAGVFEKPYEENKEKLAAETKESLASEAETEKERKKKEAEKLAKEMQRGRIKTELLFGDLSEEERKRIEKQIDMEYIKETYGQVFGRVIDALLQEKEKGEVFFQKEGERKAIGEIIEKFGPNSDYGFTREMCEEIFYGAQEWIYQKIDLAERVEKGKKEGKGAIITKGLLKGVLMGYAPIALLGPGGIAITGALRALDLLRSRRAKEKIANKWKKKWREEDKTRNDIGNDIGEYLSFTIANLRENTLRRERASEEQPRTYENYFEKIKTTLKREREINEKRKTESPEEQLPIYTDEEINEIARAWAVYYYSDDLSEQRRFENQEKRPSSIKGALEFIHKEIGDRTCRWLGIGKLPESLVEKFYSAMTFTGVSFALLTVKKAAGLEWLAPLTGAYAGYKFADLFRSFLLKEKTPEMKAETSLREMEDFLQKNRGEEIALGRIGSKISGLGEIRIYLEQIKNPIEYAKQKERFKAAMMELLQRKFLLEEDKVWDETLAKMVKRVKPLTEEEIVAFGKKITGEVTAAERVTLEEERRKRREDALGRWTLRIGGAVLGGASAIVVPELFREAKKIFAQIVGGPEAPVESGVPPEGMAKLDAEIEELDQTIKEVNLSDDLDPKEMWHLQETSQGTGEEAERAQKLLELLREKNPTRYEAILKQALSTIHEGEGIQHALIRQLRNDPETFGCPAEIIKKGPEAVRGWAEGEAHRICLERDYVKVLPDGRLEETRVFYDPKEKIQYILQPDGTVEEVATEGMEYIYETPVKPPPLETPDTEVEGATPPPLETPDTEVEGATPPPLETPDTEVEPSKEEIPEEAKALREALEKGPLLPEERRVFNIHKDRDVAYLINEVTKKELFEVGRLDKSSYDAFVYLLEAEGEGDLVNGIQNRFGESIEVESFRDHLRNFVKQAESGELPETSAWTPREIFDPKTNEWRTVLMSQGKPGNFFIDGTRGNFDGLPDLIKELKIGPLRILSKKFLTTEEALQLLSGFKR